MHKKKRAYIERQDSVSLYRQGRQKNYISLQKSPVNVWQSIIKPVTLAKMVPICERLFIKVKESKKLP